MLNSFIDSNEIIKPYKNRTIQITGTKENRTILTIQHRDYKYILSKKKFDYFNPTIYKYQQSRKEENSAIK